MKRNRFVLLATASAVLLAASGAWADDASDLGAALTSGKAGVNVRARYEGVDKDNALDDANALTARLRLNYRTGQWNGWSAFAEFDNVFHFISDFNAGGGTTPDKAPLYQVVADPKGSDLNQIYFDYKYDEDWMFRAGRQRILLDNQRFVGGVGWRQNEQTYDAFTLDTKAINKTTLQYSYVGYVRRIFGQTSPVGKHNNRTHLINAKIDLPEGWSVTPYYYHIENRDAAAFSTATLGARLAGSIKAGDGKISLVGEFARQSDVNNNPVSYNANYLHIDGAWVLENGLSLGVGYESLGGDSAVTGASFRTPLATLHKFQGWADLFLATPDAGIEDLYFTAKYKAGNWNLVGVYHHFGAEATNDDWGSEFDISAGTKLGKNYGILLKGAFFSSDSTSYQDTNKFWLMFTANY
jgi:hypothetical protein